MISSQAAMIASARSCGTTPSSRFARAAAFFTYARLRTKWPKGWTGIPEMGKFSMPRRVCTP